MTKREAYARAAGHLDAACRLLAQHGGDALLIADILALSATCQEVALALAMGEYQRLADELNQGVIYRFVESREEAEALKADYLAKGALAVEFDQPFGLQTVHVYVTLEKDKATAILGYMPSDKEWEESFD